MCREKWIWCSEDPRSVSPTLVFLPHFSAEPQKYTSQKLCVGWSSKSAGDKQLRLPEMEAAQSFVCVEGSDTQGRTTASYAHWEAIFGCSDSLIGFLLHQPVLAQGTSWFRLILMPVAKYLSCAIGITFSLEPNFTILKFAGLFRKLIFSLFQVVRAYWSISLPHVLHKQRHNLYTSTKHAYELCL